VDVDRAGWTVGAEFQPRVRETMSAHGQFSLWPETDDKIKIAYQRGLRGTGFFTIQIEVLAGGSTKEKQRVYILDEIGEQINVELEKKTK